MYRIVLACVCLLALGEVANAQTVVVYQPAMVAPAPVFVAPRITYAPVMTPVPVTAYRPIVPMTAFSPTVTFSPVEPVVTAPVLVPAPVYFARPVIVRPKYYYPGQPIRNFFRAITP